MAIGILLLLAIKPTTSTSAYRVDGLSEQEQLRMAINLSKESFRAERRNQRRSADPVEVARNPKSFDAIVSGAGTPAANGVYTFQSIDWNGKPVWKKSDASGAVHIKWASWYNWHGAWTIVSNYNYLYHNPRQAEAPARSGWRCAGGSEPVPTLRFRRVHPVPVWIDYARSAMARAFGSAREAAPTAWRQFIGLTTSFWQGTVSTMTFIKEICELTFYVTMALIGAIMSIYYTCMASTVPRSSGLMRLSDRKKLVLFTIGALSLYMVYFD